MVVTPVKTSEKLIRIGDRVTLCAGLASPREVSDFSRNTIFMEHKTHVISLDLAICGNEEDPDDPIN